MGKKGSWLSAIKRVFTPSSKDKSVILNDSDVKENNKTKKKKKLRHVDTNSFIPLFREPSSIEKIFGDFEREQQRQGLRPPPQSPKTSSSAAPLRPTSPTPRAEASLRKQNASPRRPQSPKTCSSAAPLRPTSPMPSLRKQNASATRIQAVYRGYKGRKRLRAVKGLARLQGVVRGQSVKRQTANAMKYMQLVVRVQSQIQSRRIQMLDTSPTPPHSSAHWDDSVQTKEEAKERREKKAAAIVKRERAMAYAYSHQLWTHQRPQQKGWYNWLDRHIPQYDTPTPRSSMPTPVPTSPFQFPARDSDSLTSCPAFSRPNYMTPTASAKAKSRAGGSPRERFMPPTPTHSNRRLSFPFVRGSPSFLSPSSNNVKSRPKSVISVGNASVDSTLSMPAAMGRKPFNRFV